MLIEEMTESKEEDSSVYESKEGQSKLNKVTSAQHEDTKQQKNLQLQTEENE